jgi:hypothetical protein
MPETFGRLAAKRQNGGGSGDMSGAERPAGPIHPSVVAAG